MSQTDFAAALAALPLIEGLNHSTVDGVCVYKASQPLARVPLCYSQGIIIVAQGKKRVYLDNQIYNYDPNNYLVLTLPLPAECETLLEPSETMLSLLIDIDLTLLVELVRVFEEQQRAPDTQRLTESSSLYVSACTEKLSASVLKLAQCLSSPLESAVLGNSLKREILFHVLASENAGPLFELASHNTHLARLERSLNHLHQHYSQSLDVDKLASLANMSPSTFHRNFKQLTSSSPIQYLKKIRLNRARELLTDQGLKVKQAAAQVGYESATQFSREFKRYYGHSPQQTVSA